MKLLGLAGKSMAGKDTFALPLIQSHGWSHLKFADPLKDMIRSLLRSAGVFYDEIEEMVEGNNKETPSPIFFGKSARFAMQTLGTDWRDMIHPDLWTNILETRLRNMEHANVPGVVITDVRFPHEVNFIHRLGGYVVRLNRVEGNKNITPHSSESYIESLNVDEDVYNNASVEALWARTTSIANLITDINVKE